MGSLFNRLPAASLTIGVTALLAATGCSAGDPRACTVTCGPAGECPPGTECGQDGYCYLPEQEMGSCSAAEEDAGGGRPDAGESDAGPDPEPASFAGESSPALSVPDDSPAGIETVITADVATLEVATVQVHLEIQHTWRGDMVLTLRSPAGETAAVVQLLPDDAGADVRGTFDVVGFTSGSSGVGDWTLRLVDRGPGDVGFLEYWSIGINEDAP